MSSFLGRTLRAFSRAAARERFRASFRPRVEALEDRLVPSTVLVGPTRTYTTIQAGVNAANPGDTVLIDPGTYAETVIVNKSLTIEGIKHGQNASTRFSNFTSGANGPKADPTVETVLTAPSVSPGSAILLQVEADNVTIDGLVVDGNNPSLAASTLTDGHGVNIDVLHAITNGDPNSPTPVSNLVIENDIVQNVAERCVSLDNNGTVPTTNETVTGNVIRDFGSDSTGGQGVILLANAYADVSSNAITDVVGLEICLQMQNFSLNGSMTWSSNLVTVGQDGIGIDANLFTAPAGRLTITGNTVNAAGGVQGTTTNGDITWGINVISVGGGSTVNVTSNTVGNSGGQFGRGINLWNLTTSDTVTVSGGTVGNSVTGINLDSVDPYFGAGGASSANINTVGISGAATGVRVRAVTVSPYPGFTPASSTPSASVQASLTSLNITGCTTGVLVAGFNSTITATTTLVTNTIANGTTGIDVEADGLFGSGSMCNLISGNSHAGLVYNDTPTLNASENWWGSPTGPAAPGNAIGTGNAILGSGAADVNYRPWADSVACTNFINVISNFPADPGFETPSVGAGHFMYAPAGSPWTFQGGAGVAANGSGFTSSNPPAPQGTQVAFLQQTGSLSQSVYFVTAGTYTISFSAAQRNGQSQSILVKVDGSPVSTLTPVGSTYATYSTATFNVTAGPHTLYFVGLNPNGGDNTALIDQVAINAAPLPQLADPGFEGPGLGAGNFKYAPAGSPWAFTGTSGLAANGSGFTGGNPPAPQGTQVAFLQQTGSFSQAAYFPAGTYVLSFSAAQRSGQHQTIQVQVDGSPFAGSTFTPGGSSYSSFTTATFTVLTAGTHIIAFVGTVSSGDNTALIDQVALNTTAAAQPGDAGFEAVSVGAGNFMYAPTGSPWTFTGAAGLAANGSGFTSSNPSAPQGTQVAFLQKTGSFSQSVTFAAGTYVISFSAAQRSGQSQTIEVEVGGNLVGIITPTGSTYATYTSGSFTVPTGSATVAFVGLNPNGGDNTAFIDQVTISAVPVAQLADPGFEGPSLGSGNFKYVPTGSPWTFTGAAGLAANGSGFTASNPPAPEGQQVAFLQKTGSFSQAADFAAGTYSISFSAAQRSGQSQTVEVLVDGNVKATVTPLSSSYLTYLSASFTLTAGNHTIKFLGLNPGGGDNTAFIDQVSINLAS